MTGGTWKKEPEKIVVPPSRAVQPQVQNPSLDEPTRPNPTSEPTQQPSANSKKGSGTEEHEAFLISAEEGHEDAILRLIKKGVDVNAKGGIHGNALTTAAYNNRKTIVKTLIEHGALIDQPGGPDGFALHSAASQGHGDVVKVLLGRGADVQIQGGQWRFALTAGKFCPSFAVFPVPVKYIRRDQRKKDRRKKLTINDNKPAAFNGSIRIMKMLLNEGAELNALDTENESALHGAVFGGHIEAVTFLLGQGIKPDTIGDNGTPLDIAQRTGQVSIANLLSGDTTSSADDDNSPNNPPLTTTDSNNKQPPLTVSTQKSEEQPLDQASAETIATYLSALLVASAQTGATEDVQVLLDAGVSPNSAYGPHGYALHAACANGHIATAQALLEAGASIDAFGGVMGYALHAACLSGSCLLVLLLVAWGANIHAGITTFGYPLHIAAANGDVKTMALLLSLGADIDAYGGDFGTAIMAAASSGLEPSVFLVQKGANILRKAPNGLSVVDMARAYRHQDTKNFFKQRGAKSSGIFSIAGLASRLQSFSLRMEEVNKANNNLVEPENVLGNPATAAATATAAG